MRANRRKKTKSDEKNNAAVSKNGDKGLLRYRHIAKGNYKTIQIRVTKIHYHYLRRSEMEVYTNFEGNNIVFGLVGELDEHSAAFVRRKMDEKLQEENFENAVLDLSRLSFMDSTGIGVVIGRYKLLCKQNKRLFVRDPSPTVDKIFRMSGLYEIIARA